VLVSLPLTPNLTTLFTTHIRISNLQYPTPHRCSLDSPLVFLILPCEVIWVPPELVLKSLQPPGQAA